MADPYREPGAGHSSAALTNGSVGRRARDAAAAAADEPHWGWRSLLKRFWLPMLALAVMAGVNALVLFYAPLDGLPDTQCGTARSPVQGLCGTVVGHRQQLVAAVAALSVVFAITGVRGFHRRNHHVVPWSYGAAVLAFAAAIYLSRAAVESVAVGTQSGECGSVLSKVDEHGAYASGRPQECAPGYRKDRQTAWNYGAATVVVFAVGLTLVGV